MSKFKIGEIALLDLGSFENNQVRGHEQANIRPCVVIKPINELKLIIIVPITTTVSNNPFFSKVEINKDDSPLPEDSFALCHQIRTVSIDRVKKTLGVLPQKYLDIIQFVLLDLLELN